MQAIPPLRSGSQIRYSKLRSYDQNINTLKRTDCSKRGLQLSHSDETSLHDHFLHYLFSWSDSKFFTDEQQLIERDPPLPNISTAKIVPEGCTIKDWGKSSENFYFWIFKNNKLTFFLKKIAWKKAENLHSQLQNRTVSATLSAALESQMMVPKMPNVTSYQILSSSSAPNQQKPNFCGSWILYRLKMRKIAKIKVYLCLGWATEVMTALK